MQIFKGVRNHVCKLCSVCIPAQIFQQTGKMHHTIILLFLFQVILDKLPDPKIGLALSQTEFTVDKNNEFIIEITFKPLLEGSGRECIHVKDVNKNKKISDIFINWESINPNPPKMKKKKPLALETKILTQNKVIGKKTHVKNTTVPNKPLWKSSYGYPSVSIKFS
jgi:hypothetical protein